VLDVREGQPVDTYPTRNELLTRLENEAMLIGDKALSALLMQLHKQLELENMAAAQSLSEAIAARIEQLGDKGKISAELKATMLGWLEQIESQL